MNVAADQLRAIVDRILRLKEEQDQLAADIKEIYAEAKSQGFDKTALGQVVSLIRAKAKNPAAFEEKDAMVSLYLETYEGSHAHTCEAAATALTIATRAA